MKILKKSIPLFIFVCIGCVICLYIQKTQHSSSSDCLIHQNETIKSLEAHQETCIKTLLSNFLSKGGTFIRLQDKTKPFVFFEQDVVFPSCSG
ncbi:MAG: hypothetical protein JSS09_07750 [Verrucomicrobia bacterium]|nr:hypothetical protein [Verrucomicrobiota bacterium]